MHLLMKLESLAHQFGLQARRFRQLLSSQRFVERTAFTRLAQLLPLGSQLVEQRLCCWSAKLSRICFIFAF